LENGKLMREKIPPSAATIMISWKMGNIIRSLNDSAKADTSHYEWNKDNALIWKEHASDSTGKNTLCSETHAGQPAGAGGR
jgi:hypothetical protein